MQNRDCQSIQRSKGLRKQAIALAAFAACATASFRSYGQVAYTFSGTTYGQNFSTLPATASGWADHAAASTGTMYGGTAGTTTEGTYTLPANGTPFDLFGLNTGGSGASINGGSALQGWYALAPASGSNDNYASDSGSFTTGSLYSYGAVGSNNRSLGMISTGASGSGEVGVLLYNNTATTFTQFSLSYAAQLWHNAANARSLVFGYGVYTSDTALPTSGLTTVSSLGSGNFTTGTATNTELTSPIATNSVMASHLALSTAWAPGDYIWLTLAMNTNGSGGQGLAVSNFSFTPGVASTDTWSNGTANNKWDIQTSNNWTISGGAGSYSDGDNTIFAGAGMTSNVGTVTVTAAGVNPGGVTVSNSTGTYKFLNATSATAGIGGSGGITMSGAGTLDLTGMTVSNTYAGGINLNAGTVVISSDNQLGAPSGGLAFNGGTLRTTTGITTARGITLTGAGTIDTDGNTDTDSGGFSGSGALNVVGGGSLSLSGGNITIADATVAASTNLVLNQAALGTVTLGTDTTGSALAGNLQVNNGIQLILNGGSFSGGGTIGVNATATYIESKGTLSSIGNAIIVNNGSTFTPGTVTGTYSPDSFVTAVGATAGFELVVSGGLSAAGGGTASTGLNFQGASGTGGAGTVIINSQLKYAGTTQINMGSGTIQLAVANALPTSTDLIVGTNSNLSAPLLDLDGNGQQFASLSNGASASTSHYLTISNESSNAATLTIGGSTIPSTTFRGTIEDGAGTVNLVRAGTGDTILQQTTNGGTYSYSGVTNITGGELELQGAKLTGSGAVTVSGGTFGGTGTVAGQVNVNSGSLVEGLNVGTTTVGSLTVANSVTMQTGSVLDVKIQQLATGSTGVEGTDNDTLVLTGGGSVFSPGSAALDVIPNGTFASTSGFSYTYVIVDASAASLAAGQTFAGLAQGQVYTQGGLSYSVDYGVAQPGDIELTVTSVPEPAVGMVLFGMGGLLMSRRRAVKNRAVQNAVAAHA
jgi:hypothetical protein